jgi:hypothetical protein
MAKLSFLAMALVVASCTAFAPRPPSVAFSRHVHVAVPVRPLVRIFQEKEDTAASEAEAAFVSPEQGEAPAEASLETVESLGRGAAKVNTHIYYFIHHVHVDCRHSHLHISTLTQRHFTFHHLYRPNAVSARALLPKRLLPRPRLLPV